MPIFIIEHLEPRLYKWCIMEYKHISAVVGKQNLWFTNVKSGALGSYGRAINQSVAGLNLKNACVLDPEAEKILCPGERFDYYIFGGILGDSPPQKRTKPGLTARLKDCAARNIGNAQMSTDNAVYVVNQIAKGIPLHKLKFQDGLEIRVGKGESVILPYRYVLVQGKPLICRELKEHLKRRRVF